MANESPLDIFACAVCHMPIPQPARTSWTCAHCGSHYPSGRVPVAIPLDTVPWAKNAQINRHAANAYYQRRLDNNDGWWVDRSAYFATLRRHDWRAYRGPIAKYIGRTYRNPTVVDAGGGDGWFLKHCEELLPGMRGVLVDLSDTVVWSGMERNHFRSVTGIGGSIEHLPFRSESVDVIVSIEVLEHVRNPEDFFASAWRILKPGGSFVVTTPNPLSYALGFEEGGFSGMTATLLAAMKGRPASAQREVRDIDGVLERYLTPRQIISLARNAGFAKVVHHSVGVGLAPKPYYLAEKQHWPLAALKLYEGLASRAERVAVYRGWLPWGKVQRVTCVK